MIAWSQEEDLIREKCKKVKDGESKQAILVNGLSCCYGCSGGGSETHLIVSEAHFFFN